MSGAVERTGPGQPAHDAGWSARHFRALVQSTSDVILVVDGRGTVSYATPSVLATPAVVRKPFSPGRLARAVREALDAPDSSPAPTPEPG